MAGSSASPPAPPAHSPLALPRLPADEDEHSAEVLHQELIAKGYRGHYQRVKAAVAPWHETHGIQTPPPRASSPLQFARWIITPPGRRPLEAQERLGLLFAHCPGLVHVHEPVREFATMVDQRDATALPGWLNRLATRGHAPLASLVKGIREDQDAVARGMPAVVREPVAKAFHQRRAGRT